MLRPSRSDQGVILSFRINRDQEVITTYVNRISFGESQLLINDLRLRLLSLHMQYQSHIYNCFSVYKKA